MRTSAQRETATIYQFPIGGRAGLAQQNQRNDTSVSAYLNSLGACQAPAGSGWYHEEAMEAERQRKN